MIFDISYFIWRSNNKNCQNFKFFTKYDSLISLHIQKTNYFTLFDHEKV